MVDSPDSSFDLISNSSHSDVDEPREVEKEKKARMSSAASTRTAPKELTAMQMTGLLIVVVVIQLLLYLCLFGAPSKTNNVTEQKVNKTLEHQNGLFDSQRLREEIQKLNENANNEEEAMKIVRARNSLSEKRCLKQFPDSLLNKWVLKPEKFEGLEEFIQLAGINGTDVEAFLYLSTPFIEIIRADSCTVDIKWVSDKVESMKGKKYEIGSIVTLDYHRSTYHLHNGEMDQYEEIIFKNQKLKFKRVYYIPTHELI